MTTMQKFLAVTCLALAAGSLPVLGADRVVIVEEFTRIG